MAIRRVKAAGLLIIGLLAVCPAAFLAGQELVINEAAPPPRKDFTIFKEGQLPGSTLVSGDYTVWLAGATDRYRHGILGDYLEASMLFVETGDGVSLSFELPPDRVFEDLVPRLVDLDHDGIDEIILIESDIRLGASLSVFSIRRGRIERLASSGFIGRRNRWLNPVGVGDFNGDGIVDIALVETPHIGGILKIYSFENDRLSLLTSFSGVSNHSIGSMELGLGAVVQRPGTDMLLLPDQSHGVMLLLKWGENGMTEAARRELPARLVSSLMPLESELWSFLAGDRGWYQIRIRDDLNIR